MSDRLAEIRARLDSLLAQDEDYPDAEQVATFDSHAPADIAWLLDALDAERRQKERLVQRLAAFGGEANG